MTFPSKLDDYRWLSGPEAQPWLKIAAEASQKPGFSAVRLATQLRAKLSQAQTRLVLEQTELRRRGSEKFAKADSLFFTPLGLEQATDDLVAAYKASRFPQAVPIADLCCGIGGDALGLAGRGPVLAIDRDPVATMLTEANLRIVLGNENSAAARISDVDSILSKQIELQEFAAWHIDPDRRPTGRRTTKVELHEPGPEIIRQLLAINPNAAVKLSPAAELSDDWWFEAELEWISRGRQCRQLVAWFGNLAQHAGQRRATIISGQLGEQPSVAATFIGEPEMECPCASKVARYVFEPDAAILAAKMEGALAVKHGLSAIAYGVAYFTGDRIIEDNALACFEVLETMPYDVRRLKAWLREHCIGQIEIKKRGVPLKPEQVRRELRTEGDDAATILLMRVAGQVMAIVAQRISVSV